MLRSNSKSRGVIVIFNQATNVEPRPPLSSRPLYQTQEVTRPVQRTLYQLHSLQYDIANLQQLVSEND